MAMATAILDSISCSFISIRSWLSIFSGFSDLFIRSFTFDEIRVFNLEKIPILSGLLYPING
jgi:hypothetical protein